MLPSVALSSVNIYIWQCFSHIPVLSYCGMWFCLVYDKQVHLCNPLSSVLFAIVTQGCQTIYSGETFI